MKPKTYTRTEFMQKTGINDRRKLSKLIAGYKSRKIFIPPVLIKGVDYEEMKFFQSAVEKVEKKK